MKKLNPSFWWLLSAGVILLPVLFFPLASDHCIYLKAAETISWGGSIYSDFIDLKPAFLYYVYWAISEIFSSNPIGIRIFDILFQLLTCGVMYRIVNKSTGNDTAAGLSIVIYSVLIVSLGHKVLFTQGIFLNLVALVVLLYLDGKKRRLLSFILPGILVGLITGMKYSYGILLPAFLLTVFLRSDFEKRRVKISIAYLSGFTAAFLLTLLPLLSAPTRTEFATVSEFLNAYVSTISMDFQFVKNMFIKFGKLIGYNLTLPVVIAVFGTLFVFVKNYTKINTKEKNFLSAVMLFGFMLLLSVFVERRFPDYIFLRLYPVVAILSGIFTALLIAKINSEYKYYDNQKKLVLLFVLIGVVITGPTVRYLYRAKTSVTYLTNKEAYNSAFSSDGLSEYNHSNVLKLADYFESNLPEVTVSGKEPVLITVQTGMVLLDILTPNYRHSAFGHSQFYIAKFAPEKWKKRFIDEVTYADYLMFSKWDCRKSIIGYNDIPNPGMSSYEFFFESDFEPDFTGKVKQIIGSEFEMVEDNNRYVVFKRRVNEKVD
jgi:4-amino-4-deoxy-L-arabinose transferase-like glycosyltransferase